MLTRQKIVLALLERAGRSLSSTALVKMIFLLRQKTRLKNDRTFYDFVPYKYGPFSFVLYRELSGLRNQGYILPGEEQVELVPRTYELTRRAASELPDNVRSAVAAIVASYGKMAHKTLLETVYRQYPWYASKSELTDLAPKTTKERPLASIAVYTIGYEGKSVDDFFNGLLRVGIRTILDVRANPVSRKYGFARKSLQDISAKLGLDYHHFPELGIAGEDRLALATWEDYQRLLDRYEREMLPKQGDALQAIVRLLNRGPSALLCMESDVRCCHRGRLAKAAAELSGLSIMHL